MTCFWTCWSKYSLGVCFSTHMGSGNIQKKCAYSSRSIYHATTSGVVPKSSVQSINDFLCSMHSSYAVCLHFILPLLCFDAFFRHVFVNNSSTIIKAFRDNSFFCGLKTKQRRHLPIFFLEFSVLLITSKLNQKEAWYQKHNQLILHTCCLFEHCSFVTLKFVGFASLE